MIAYKYILKSSTHCVLWLRNPKHEIFQNIQGQDPLLLWVLSIPPLSGLTGLHQTDPALLDFLRKELIWPPFLEENKSLNNWWTANKISIITKTDSSQLQPSMFINSIHHVRTYRVVFLTAPPPISVPKIKSLSSQSRPFWSSSCGWLIGSFRFGTEIGGAS